MKFEVESFMDVEKSTLMRVCVLGQVASYDAIALPALHVWEVMRRIKGTTHGLAPTFLDPNHGASARFGSNHVTLGARGDSYYEYAFELPLDLYQPFCLQGPQLRGNICCYRLI